MVMEWDCDGVRLIQNMRSPPWEDVGGRAFHAGGRQEQRPWGGDELDTFKEK
jgi:hypothetical protein